jgi:hypothetical protein
MKATRLSERPLQQTAGFCFGSRAAEQLGPKESCLSFGRPATVERPVKKPQRTYMAWADECPVTDCADVRAGDSE